LGLWVRGSADLGSLLWRAVVVLGASTATPYGTETAFGLAAELAAACWTVVSSGEFGVPGAAQRGVLSVDRPGVVFPAGGLAGPRPLGHSRVFNRTARSGLVVSESLPTPDRELDRQRRARLLVATGAALVLIEPQPGGLTGAAIRLARQHGCPLLVQPGPVTCDRSAFAHRLLRDGTARLIRGAQDVLADLHTFAGQPP
jgi:DNA processing protein